MAKTNTGLAEYCLAKVNCYYWFGTFGQMASRSLYNSKKSQYPNYYTASDFSKQIANPKQVFDCAGLIKAYLWTKDINDTKPVYHSSQDYGATGFYDHAKIKGKLTSSVKMKVGTLVFKGNDKTKSHVGVFCGNDLIVEAKGHAYGVITSKLSSGGWGYYAECHLITYSDEPTPVPTKDMYTVHTNSGDALRLRAEPNTSSKQVGYINNGTTFKSEKIVKGESIGGVDTWAYYDGGYASGKYLDPTPTAPEPQPTPTPTTTKYMVKTNGGTLSLRNAPKLTGSIVIASIPNGTILDVSEIVTGEMVNNDTNWAKTTYDGKQGYCTCSWLMKCDSNAEYYTVKKGDTLWQIAQAHGMTLADILKLNTISNPNVISIGQTIRIK